MYFYFLKIIFDINASKLSKNIKKYINLKQKNTKTLIFKKYIFLKYKNENTQHYHQLSLELVLHTTRVIRVMANPCRVEYVFFSHYSLFSSSLEFVDAMSRTALAAHSVSYPKWVGPTSIHGFTMYFHLAVVSPLLCNCKLILLFFFFFVSRKGIRGKMTLKVVLSY